MVHLVTWLSLSNEKLLFEWDDLSVALALICSQTEIKIYNGR